MRRFESSRPSQALGSPGYYFPVGGNPRHSRGLSWRAPVSDRQFLVFRSVRGGFRAPVSAGGFPISVSAVQRPVRERTERAVCRAPFRTRRTPARVHGIGRSEGRLFNRYALGQPESFRSTPRKAGAITTGLRRCSNGCSSMDRPQAQPGRSRHRRHHVHSGC